MEHLIDKDALVVEIEKCYNECLKRAKVTDPDYWNAKADAYRNVLVILDDTFEVKEVDYRPIDNDFERDAVNFCFDNGLNTTPRIAKTIAKHFFELGLSVNIKAQKGEEV